MGSKGSASDFQNPSAVGGVLLLVMVALAMLLANSPLSHWYHAFLGTPVSVQVGEFKLHKPMLLWINDLLMAFFFSLVGLEVKRALLQGTLSKGRRAVLPVIAAIGGMVVPALVFLAFNAHNPLAATGWAIPSVTDIAFALGVLTLLGSRVPLQLRVFLLALAIIDDLLAIVIIALFYSEPLSAVNLALALFAFLSLLALNRCGVMKLVPYMLLGMVLWVAVLNSGVHATLAGVVLAFTIPLGTDSHGVSPSQFLERELHNWSTYLILPIFAFANGGVDFTHLSLSQVFSPLTLGIALGLCLGKPVGVLSFCAVAVRLGLATLPKGVGWLPLTGVAMLCGIGFTMAMFFASLAFEVGALNYSEISRIGILLGSAISAVGGYLLLRWAYRPSAKTRQATKRAQSADCANKGSGRKSGEPGP
ncbi:Na+/H+ antiporter NhaA [Ferrimonas kyonanensis]|uniref:Na+/H+ antiporter NhaA n=1 Tax=Ferrimonas kyonanensis TaxID=364763 RepID=UPI0004063147|nr:Na+/H+ antiporter NhaA [Ferrimonas kyonanensis]